jgi:hypothetical protein
MDVHLVIKNLPAGRTEIEGVYADRSEALEHAARFPVMALVTLPLRGTGPAELWRLWRHDGDHWSLVVAGRQAPLRAVMNAIDPGRGRWELTEPGAEPKP